jgi:hypothetical protein
MTGAKATNAGRSARNLNGGIGSMVALASGWINGSKEERMDYDAARRAGEPQGSGAMESSCRQYQCRFKRPGQFWSCAGDEALMCLETFWRNKRWHLLFPHSTHGDPSEN